MYSNPTPPESETNRQIIGTHFLPCCVDSFPPGLPSHPLRLIASERRANNRPQRSHGEPRGTDPTLFSDACQIFKRRDFIIKPRDRFHHTICRLGKGSVFSFLVMLAPGSPSTDSDITESHHNVAQLCSPFAAAMRLNEDRKWKCRDDQLERSREVRKGSGDMTG